MPGSLIHLPVASTPAPTEPTFVSQSAAVQHQVWSGNHTVNVSIDVPYAGGILLVPMWINSSSWVSMSGISRSVTSSLGDTVTAVPNGTIDAWAGSGSESHGGAQMWAKVNPTVGTHVLTVSTGHWQNYEILGAGAMFYAKCSAITQSGTAAGGGASSRSLNVASGTGRTTLGLFINDNPAATANGTARWAATSLDIAGWTDRVLVQEIPGAASVTHSISGGGGAWGIGFDLTP
ncbi:hypothetical protein [Arthrobacter sp. SLBN-53]|uniref:hypothetical protein n=1 Tax=Arthrobacter sp. SLBN-53 TaxID=2768412 RepID=UPI001151DF60|nr:hypothetical protein [Arthrobacter sp. SLBN-53]TQK29364.1 hypothetical protein FBY28_2367 [Arthrobacter sp. SLBN-53]